MLKPATLQLALCLRRDRGDPLPRARRGTTVLLLYYGGEDQNVCVKRKLKKNPLLEVVTNKETCLI